MRGDSITRFGTPPPHGRHSEWTAPVNSQNKVRIVFVDVVEYSKYSDEDQVRVISSLNAEISRELYPLFSRAGATPNLICLPAGDGLAMVFLNSESGTLFALLHALMAWTRTVTKRFSLQRACRIRIGVHSGSLSIVTDINRMAGVCGDGINRCRRIMDAARPNQVLLSEEAYKDLLGENRNYPLHPFTPKSPAVFSEPVGIVVKHEEPIRVRVMYRIEDDAWTGSAPASIPQVIDGPDAALRKTRFITRTLEELEKVPDREIEIDEQATYSTFGIADFQGKGGYNPELNRATLEQRQRLLSLLSSRRVSMRVLLQPIPRTLPTDEWIRLRYKTLMEWMRTHLREIRFLPSKKGKSTIRFLESTDQKIDPWSAPAPNLFIVKNHLRVDGFRLRNGVNHGLSLVYYDDGRIREAVERFDTHFHEGRNSNRAILNRLEALFKSRSRR